MYLSCFSHTKMCFGHTAWAYGITVPWSGIKPTPPAMKGRGLTTGPPGKSLTNYFYSRFFNFISLVWYWDSHLENTCCCCCLAAKSCLTLCNPTDYSTPGFSAHCQLPELAQTHGPQVSDAIQSSFSSAVPFSSCLQSFPAWGSFPRSQFFTSGGQSIGASASASASVLPMYIQDWFPLGLTGLIFLQSKGLSRAFSSTTVQKHQFFGNQLSL